jgi:adenylate kinase
MKNIILFGAPGSGKGTQSHLLEKELAFKHISTGNILRAEVAAKTELGLRCSDLMAKGEVSDELTHTINAIVAAFIEKNLGATGFIFDGFPRTKSQAEFLDKFLKETGFPLTRVFQLKVDRDILVKRLTGRYTCANCGAIFNKYFNPVRVENECDECKSNEFVTRKDDAVETVEHRLDVYDKETSHLIDHYRGQGIMKTLNGLDEPEVIFNVIRAELFK